MDHIYKLSDYLVKHDIEVIIHAFLDGRDTPPKSVLRFTSNLHIDKIKTISGRFYAMDRDNNWDRTKSAYDLITNRICEKKFDNLENAINYYYTNKITDEFIPPSIIGDYNGMQDGDGILIANFRSDRIRQITSELIGKTNSFKNKIKFSQVLTMTQYFDDLFLPTILPKHNIINTLGEIISNAGMKQLRIAETEKYAHVTYFFNGGGESLLKNEEQILINSPNVKTYNMKPEMSAEKITEKLIPKILSKEFDLIVLNYANADMVGHTGDFQATVSAIETIDKCLEKVSNAALASNSTLIITADHGNAECMYDDHNKMPHTAHTTNYVPIIILDETVKKIHSGRLSDIAPTILKLLKIQKPSEMSGNSLISS
jgi:2,3-bisphosphoglycerate-independent phosphoglycerate mutase